MTTISREELARMSPDQSCYHCAHRALENCIYCSKVVRIRIKAVGEEQLVWKQKDGELVQECKTVGCHQPAESNGECLRCFDRSW